MLISSVDRALDVLLLLHGEGREMGVSEIAEKLGVYKSTIFRTLFTLEQKGFVKQNPTTEKYWLGMKVFNMGMSMKDKISIKKVISPYIKTLQQEFSEVVNVAIMDVSIKHHPMCLTIDKEIGENQMLITNPAVGATSSCYGSSVGKCLLAFSDMNLEALRTDDLPRYTEHTITDWDELVQNIQKVKQDGYALDDEELEIGLTCIGAPILDGSGKAIAAISLSGPTQRMRSGDFQYRINKVVQTARNISNEFL